MTLGAPPSGEASAPVAQPAGRCSWFLPDSSSLDRYLWALQWFAANGFYVLSEFRPAPGEATARNQQGFVDSWAWLWQHVRCLPNFEADLKGRVFVDLLGAPDAAGLRWEAAAAGPEGVSVPGAGSGRAGVGVSKRAAVGSGCSQQAVCAQGCPCAIAVAVPSQPNVTPSSPHSLTPGLTELYLGAMDALWGASPGSLAFFVAGAGQGGDEKWGSGFVTDKATIAVNDYSGARAAAAAADRWQRAGGSGLRWRAGHACCMCRHCPRRWASLSTCGPHSPPPLPDPNPFFTALLAKPYRGAVVIAPSVYSSAAPAPPQSGPDPITGAPPPPPAWPAGAGPLKIMDTTFSYLAKEGYGLGADCQRFPVAVGEFASRLAAGGGELAALNAFAAHLSSVGVEYGGVGTWRFWSFDAAPASS